MAHAQQRAAQRHTDHLHHPGRHINLDGESRLPQGWCPGVSEIDDALPCAGLNVGAVHEVSGMAYADAVAASGYALGLLSRLMTAAGSTSNATILWCQTVHTRQEFAAIHGAGLKAFGLDPDQFLFANTVSNRNALWALEEGARSSSLLAVVGEVGAVSFTETRRLSLAAAAHGTPVLLLRPHNDFSASAAETRWRIAAAPGAPDPFVPNAPGNARWQVKLARCRGGKPGAWTMEWCYETHRFSLAEQFSSRSPQVADTPVSTSPVHILQRRTACG